jgi:hypothetical protein
MCLSVEHPLVQGDEAVVTEDQVEILKWEEVKYDDAFDRVG